MIAAPAGSATEARKARLPWIRLPNVYERLFAPRSISPGFRFESVQQPLPAIQECFSTRVVSDGQTDSEERCFRPRAPDAELRWIAH